jgi:hypothetical protein
MAGFTLLELLISVVILLMVVTLLMAAGSGITGTWGRVRKRQAQMAELMTLDRTLDSMLSNALPFVWRDEDNQKMPVFVGDSTWLQLGYRHVVTDADAGGMRFVQLLLVDHELQAVYQQRPFVDSERISENAKVSILAQGVERLECQYADWDADEGIVWTDNWIPSDWTPVRVELPLAIMVRVVWLDGRQETWLRRTPGSSQYSRYGNWKTRLKE